MSGTHDEARREGIMEVLRQVVGSAEAARMAPNLIALTDLGPDELRAIAGLNALPVPQQRAVPHFAS
jgi:hypothetical protein